MKKILIIEDEKAIRTELKILLENSGYSVEAVEEFSNTKEEILKSKADLVLLDINIPNVNGQTLLKEIRKESSVPVIMLTSRVGEVDEILSMSYGADDYITKPYNPAILLLRMQNIFKRTEGQKNESINYNGCIVDSKKGIIEKDGEILDLTKNEMVIFSNLLSNRGNIVTRDDLMTDLWNNDEYINDNALTVNISRLRKKLEDFGLNDAIETKKGLGYKLL